MNHDFENKLWIMFEFSKVEIKSNTFHKIFMWRKFHNLCKELLNTAPNWLEHVPNHGNKFMLKAIPNRLEHVLNHGNKFMLKA